MANLPELEDFAREVRAGNSFAGYELWTKEHLMELSDSINSNVTYPNPPTPGLPWRFGKHFV